MEKRTRILFPDHATGSYSARSMLPFERFLAFESELIRAQLSFEASPRSGCSFGPADLEGVHPFLRYTARSSGTRKRFFLQPSECGTVRSLQ